MDPMATSPSITVEPITAEQTHPLRMAVLRPGRPVSECIFPGDDAELTLHVGAMLDGRIMGIGSMYHEARPADAPGTVELVADHAADTAWRLRGMASDPGLRRRGVGRAVLQACEEHARANGGTLAWCNARTPAIAFYEANGWTAFGEEFDIPTAGPHFVMEKRLD